MFVLCNLCIDTRLCATNVNCEQIETHRQVLLFPLNARKYMYTIGWIKSITPIFTYIFEGRIKERRVAVVFFFIFFLNSGALRINPYVFFLQKCVL